MIKGATAVLELPLVPGICDQGASLLSVQEACCQPSLGINPPTVTGQAENRAHLEMPILTPGALQAKGRTFEEMFSSTSL